MSREMKTEKQSDCGPIRPLVLRVDEGEAAPGEALLVARHLSHCTACRILLARERRLAMMLAEDLEDIEDLPSGDELVQSVMATLPKELPRRKRSRYRGLKLASWIALLMLLALPTIPGLSPSGWEGLAGRLPTFAPDNIGPAESAFGGIARAAIGIVLGALDIARAPFETSSLLASVAGLLALLCLGCMSALACVAYCARSFIPGLCR